MLQLNFHVGLLAEISQLPLFYPLLFYGPLQEDNTEKEIKVGAGGWGGGVIKPLSWESILSVTPSLPSDVRIAAD